MNRADWLRAAVLLLALQVSPARAQSPAVTAPAGWSDDPPVLASLVTFAHDESDLRVAVVRFTQDIAAVERRYPVEFSPARIVRLRTMAEGWRARLAALDFDGLNAEGQLDFIALRNRIDYKLSTLKLAEARAAQVAPLLPFIDDLRLLVEQRYDRQRVDPQGAAKALDRAARQARELTQRINERARLATGKSALSPVVARRAADELRQFRETLKEFNAFYDGYDPLYTWWARKPYADADAALDAYITALKPPPVPGAPTVIVGDPVLAAGLEADLAVEMIPYTPAELITIGEREFAWIEARLREVSRRMGHGDDWKAALEYTKNRAPAPGEVPWAIFDIAAYSEKFVESRHDVTLAPLAREIWRLAMQTPERQLINPFFSGGEETSLSYPTDSMTFDERMMSMRGNSPHLNFPTVQHEIVPGHHYQAFVFDRFNTHRVALNDTPFWTEGWALYWEMQLWDAPDFPRNDPDRIGMLFWRLHRAARIVFSLNYQLGRWTPQQCVEFLQNRVGHERANAEAEVRRSTIDAPLYQSGYMLGALQLRALNRELVGSGKMSAREFHDAILIGGPMPIELVRARLSHQKLTRDFRSQWRFQDVQRTVSK